MLFRRKNPHAKEVKAEIRKTRATTRAEIGEIERISEPAERLTQYAALERKLWGLHPGYKPTAMNRAMAEIGGLTGALAGLIVTCLVCSALLTVPVAAPVIGAIILGGIVVGAAGGAGLGGLVAGRHTREWIRSEYGSIRNARTMYRLGKTVEKKAAKERKTVADINRSAEMKEKFNAFNKPAPVETVAIKPAPRNQPEIKP